MKIRRYVLFTSVLVLLFSVGGRATTVQRLSLEDMTKKARTIVVGSVRSTRSYWKGNIILTSATVDVQEKIGRAHV